MDTDSDWDSLSGGGPDIEPPSISIAQESSRQMKHTPAPPTTEKIPSPRVSKISLQGTSQESKGPPRAAEQYRNTTNRARTQNVTTFRDHGELDLASENSPGLPKRNVQMPNREEIFQEIEMTESKRKQQIYNASINNKKNRSVLRDSNENLPYTEFEASDMSQVSQRKESKELLARAAMQNRARQEYVVNSPAPQEEPIKTQHKQSEDTRRSEKGKNLKKVEKERRKSKKEKRKEISVISNHHIEGYGSEDTEKDFSWEDHKFEGKDGRDHALENIVILRSAYEHGPLEERYQYEMGERRYHSTFVDKNAKMPVMADRIEQYTRRGIQEFFGALQILLDFVVIFIVELLRLIFKLLGRKLLGGIITVFGDSMLKPVLAALFNYIIQPLFILLWNVIYGFRKLLEPFLMILRDLFSHVAILLRSFRLVEWNTRVTENQVQTI